MENTVYEIVQWVANHSEYLLIPAGLAAFGCFYTAITFDPNSLKDKKNFDEEPLENSGLVKELNDAQGEIENEK